MSAPRRQSPSGEPFALDSNDRLLAALGYVFVIVAIVVAVMNETKSKPLLRDHAIQGIGFGIAAFIYLVAAGIFYIGLTIITLDVIWLLLWVLLVVPLFVAIYFAYLAYTRDGLVEMPILTDFLADQGWLETRKPA